MKTKIFVSLIFLAAFALPAQVRIRSYNALPRPVPPIPRSSAPVIHSPRAANSSPGGVPYKPITSQATKPPAYNPEDYRLVDGQLYNVMLSTNWRTVQGWTGVSAAVCRVVDKGRIEGLGDYTLIDVLKPTMDDTGKFEELHLVKRIVVKNAQIGEPLAVGEIWPYGGPAYGRRNPRLMRVGTASTDDGKPLEVYDCGTPAK